VPNKKNYWSVTMFEPAKIAEKKYYGCSTPRSVQNFCNRYNVNWFWWTPPNAHKKIMMVDWQNFRDSYKEVYGTFRTTKSWASTQSRTKKTQSKYSFKPKSSVSSRARTYQRRRAA